MDEDIAETTEALELLTQFRWNDASHRQLFQDVLVVLGADTEVCREDVIADVEDPLRSQLEASFDGPRISKVIRQVGRLQVFKTRDHLLQLQQKGPNDLRLENHDDDA